MVDEVVDEPRAVGTVLGGLAGLAAVTAAAVVAAALPDSRAPLRVVLVAAVVVACTALVPDIRVSLAVTVVAGLVVNGLLENHDGVVSWNGPQSVWPLVVLSLAAGLGLGQRWIRDARAEVAFDLALQELLDEQDQQVDRPED
ncbi:MAG TPA: hypothetical protein VFG96_04110 [Jiangellaceae bacterium]|nr:hypothetical protein [Jiangellaceae bacterium]